MITPALRRAAFLLLLALVTVAFFWIISPFFGAVFWAMVLALMFMPVHRRLRAQLRGREAERDTAIAQYNGAVLDAVKEAGDAIASVQSLGRQQALQNESAAKAEQAYDFALQRYRAGLSNQITMLNAESQVIAQRRLGVDLQARQLDTRIALMKALGGGWNDDTANLQVSQR